MPTEEQESSTAQARQVVEVFHEISTLLNADLDRSTLYICISLIENGANPEALASVVKELKREAEEARRESEAAGGSSE